MDVSIYGTLQYLPRNHFSIMGDKVMLKKIYNFYKEDIYGKRTVYTLTIVFILLMIALTYMDIVAYATKLF